MAAVVGKFAAQKLLGKQFKAYADKKVTSGEDPYFAQVPDPKRNGKFKKVKKQIPGYIPEHDALILASVRKSAYRLDCSLFELFGMRFGWESAIGLIPFAGDAIGVCMALLLFKKCMTVDGGLPSQVSMKMLINIILDFVVGLVPILGDLADAAFKANTKNLRLLERHLDAKYKPNGGRDERDYGGMDKETRRQNRKSGIYLPNDPPPATTFEDFSDDEDVRRAPSRRQGNNATRPDRVAQHNGQETGSVRR